MSSIQSISNKKGEINFRRKLSLQIQGKAEFFSGQPDRSEYIKILKRRVQITNEIFKDLAKRRIPLSPFLEVGAERCQRSMHLVSKMGLPGYATDISFESLRTADLLRKPLSLPRLPARICSDAYNLPFKSESLAFIFCFQTLHHFPDIRPVLEEIKRVLIPGGHFYFGEEPVKQKFNLRLFRRDYNLTFPEKILKALGILPFISTIGKSETSHEVVEESFDLNTWKKALSVFENIEIKIEPFPFGPTSSSFYIPILTKLIINMFGGGISALFKKQGKLKRPIQNDRLSPLSCPNCKKGSLLKSKKAIVCSSCKRNFPIENDVLFLLEDKLMQSLYPKIWTKFRS